LLTGRIFDDRGNRMSPTHARKGGIKYRYYLSSDSLAPLEPIDERTLVERHVARVEVQREQLVVELAGAEGFDPKRTLQIPWQKTIAARRREILLPDGVSPQEARPIRSETRATLVASIARGRRWLDELTSDATASAETVAAREGCSVRKVNMTISLAFLAPDLVKAAVEGRLPHGMGVARLADLPVEWSRQHQMLGLPSQ
jgi:site-specific DNA recombinase